MQLSVNTIIIISIIIEILEVSWQKGDNFLSYIENLVEIYKKNMIIFFILHPSMYYIIFVGFITNNFNFTLNILIVIKLIDLILKITIIDKILKNESLGIFELMLKENQNIPIYMKYFGVILYPIMLFIAIT